MVANPSHLLAANDGRDRSGIDPMTQPAQASGKNVAGDQRLAVTARSKPKRGTLASCTCEQCVSACLHNPGWMTPAQASAAIKAGFAKRLMCDWLEPSAELKNEKRIFVLCPATDNRGGGMAPEWEEMHGARSGGGDFLSSMLASLLGPSSYKGRCVFLKTDGCGIHTSGFKPRQCCDTLACSNDPRIGPDNYEMARGWNTKAGRAIVASWRKIVVAKAACP
jgi:hypothetical protein